MAQKFGPSGLLCEAELNRMGIKSQLRDIRQVMWFLQKEKSGSPRVYQMKTDGTYKDLQLCLAYKNRREFPKTTFSVAQWPCYYKY